MYQPNTTNPNRYMHGSRSARAAGCRVIFRDGIVIIENAVAVPCATTIDRGRWMDRPMEEWAVATPEQVAALRAVDGWCYCASFPDTGCDFCNGTRLAPGELA